METVAIATFVIKGDVLKKINPCHAGDGSRNTVAEFIISTRVLIYFNS
jgi:hypothetical protein